MGTKPKGSDPGEGSRYFSLDVKLTVVKTVVEQKVPPKEVAEVYGLHPSRVYKWVRIYRKEGEAGLARVTRSKKNGDPDPAQAKLEQEILDTKKKFSWFGIRRLVDWIRRFKALPVTASKVEKTLKKADLVPSKPKKRRRAELVRRFERSEPNQLWQVDITVWTIARGQRAYLIGFIDDHSRYIVGWGLYGAQGTPQVLEVLRNAIGQYGAPKEILSDQGRQFFAWRGKCPFQKELAREGIQHVVSRAHHPQTLGKIEAFWKHLKEEFLDRVVSGSINDMRERLKLWIDYYNFQRPHQGIDGLVPADRYFKMAQQVRDTIEKGVKENAERLALGKEPVKPFYMVGRMGNKDVVIRREGEELVMNVGDQEVEKLKLKESDDAKTKEDHAGSSGDSRPAGESAGDGGASGAVGGKGDHGDLSGDGPQASAVLCPGDPDAQSHGDGGAGERSGSKGQPVAGIPHAGGSESKAAAGQPADAGAAAADEKAVQNGPQGEKTEEMGEKAPDGGDEARSDDGIAAGGD